MKKSTREIKFIIEKTNTGFSAFAKKYPIFTTGSSIPELMNNILDASNLYFEEHEIIIVAENLKYEIDFKQFFLFYRVLNSKFLAEKIGMNPTLLSQYVKGRKKPSPSQTERILSAIHEIGKELSEINLIHR
ncbi:MAG: helix-turn-helix transcriptional regulator [Saprospiraceae bacterium]|nr:helix-turn-helix transcriptional regulator [Saprospiraceae bacterium]MBK8296492.1 helix-turn-helix transcriptional regulator [Saprospiraceae bacterium]